MQKKIPNTLYHYCSLDTFLNIIKHKSIWLSDISKSNDQQELIWLTNRYALFILKQWVNYAKSKQAVNDLQSVDFESFDKMRLLTNYMLKSNKKTSFVFCLSECRDDLGQWRGYADDGQGLSIGFKSAPFYKLWDTYSSATNDFNFNFCKVQYGDKSANQIFSNYTASMNINSEMSSEEVLSKLEIACCLSMEMAPTIKNNGFRQEKEWRLIYNINNKDIKNGQTLSLPPCLSDYDNLVNINGLSYTANRGKLVGHIELVFPKIQDIISEIIIGPKCSATEEDILLFLISERIIPSEKECNIKIIKSKSSYV